MSSKEVPGWLRVLLNEKFYNACVIHEEAKKNERNIYCLDCCFSLCPHCVPPHCSHRLLQIRRYVYHDVIRLDDATELFYCAFVQSYATNSAKVVFLNQRPQTRTFKGSANICCTSYRSLQDPYLFCSLSCKVVSVTYIYECKYLSLPEPSPDDDPVSMTPNSVLHHPAGSARSSSGSGGNGSVGCHNVVLSGVGIHTEEAEQRHGVPGRLPPGFFPGLRNLGGGSAEREPVEAPSLLN